MSAGPQRAYKVPSRLFLVQKEPAPALSQRNALAYWHLLSLDAPTVATVWMAFVGWATGLPFHLVDCMAMFLAVWMLYATDRLLDARPLFQNAFTPGLEERHRFHHAHRVWFRMGLMAAMVPLFWLLCLTSPRIFHLYLVLFVLLCAWLLLVHLRGASSSPAHRLPKEIAVGLFFPAAVFLPTAAQVPQLHPELLLPAVCFGSLCTLNGLFLFAWERPAYAAVAHPSTRWGAARVRALATAFTGAAGTLCLSSLVPDGRHLPWTAGITHPGAIFLACALSGALLLWLHASRRLLHPVLLRALADAVLLTPLPIVLLSRPFHV